MRVQFSKTEIYDVIIMGDTVLVLTEADQDLTVNGHIGAIYKKPEEMKFLGLENLIGIKRVYAFDLKVIVRCLID